MSFDAHERQLKDIFAGDASFQIPRNQRNYVWGEKNWNEMLNDIKYVFSMIPQNENMTHFIGSFVFQKDNDNYIIIDGQQRITAIMIMLSAICCIQNEKGNSDGFGRTKQYLLGDITLTSEYQRLKNDELCNLSIIVGYATEYKLELKEKTLLDKAPLSKKKKQDKDIISCFWFFYNSFLELSDNSIEKLSLIRSIIVNMKVIHIISENELDCYEVFEILNARGVSLKGSELLKNYIFKYVQPQFTVDSAKIKWNHILDNMSLCRDNIDQFLTHYFTSRFEKTSSKVDIYQLVKDRIPKNEINDLLNELVECSELYVYFYQPQTYNNKVISECLSFFNLENQRQFRPIFLSYLLAYKKGLINEKELEKSFTLIRNFYFSFGLVCKHTSNLIESGVYKVANNIYSSKNLVCANDFYNVFEKYMPSQETFINCFIEKGYSNKNKLFRNSKNRKEIKYILSSFENYYQNEKGGELHCDLDKCNVEHVLNDSDFEDTPCKIGNLLLIAEKINSKVGNDSFADKKEKYKYSKLTNVQKFVDEYGEKDDWTSEDIYKRGEKLAIFAYEKIWGFSI